MGRLLLRTGSQAMPKRGTDSKRPKVVNLGPVCCCAYAWLLALGYWPMAGYMSSSMMAGLMR